MNSADQNKSTETATHPFERAGLGKAPFKFVGMAQQDRLYGEVILNRAEYERMGVSLTTKPGGTCAYCGTGILNMYEIKSADGKLFHVGSECVNKTKDAKLVAAVKAEVKKAANVKRANQAAYVQAELIAILSDDAKRDVLARHTHPVTKRFSLLEYAEFMNTRAGAAGRAKVLKLVKEAIAG